MSEPDVHQELLDELAEDYASRCRRGEQPTVREYVERYPWIADRLRELLPSVALMEQLKRGRPGAAALPELAVPEQLGDFLIQREIGRGGMGVVYEAVQQSLGRRVALKILPRRALADPRRLDRFRREALAAARLHHTNIVPVFGLFEAEGVHFYAMQFIAGRGLDQVLDELRTDPSARDTRERGRSTLLYGSGESAPIALATHETPHTPAGEPPILPPPDALPGDHWRQVAAIGVQAADALHYAHTQGTLHRDIKPANLLLDDRDTVWITDFGLAKLTEHDGLTGAGEVLGTLQYMAPECLHGTSDARSDVYSLGLTLYELLTLRPAHTETNAARLLRQVSEQEPPHPRQVNPAVPRDLETIVLRAIQREPSRRYATARDVADDLRRYLDDQPIQARRVGPIERLGRWCRRNRALAVASGLAVGSLLVAAIVGWRAYVSTTQALAGEAERRREAESATQRAQEATSRAESNIQLSLESLEKIFQAVATPEDSQDRDGGPPRRLGPHGGRQGPPPHDDPEKHAELLTTVLSFYERFAAENATNSRLRREAAIARLRVGEILDSQGSWAEAGQAYRRAARSFATLADELPQDNGHVVRLIDVDLRLARLSGDHDTPEAEQAALDDAWQSTVKLRSRAPLELEFVALSGLVRRKQAAFARRQGNLSEAEKYYREAVALGEQAIGPPPPPPPPDHVHDLALAREGLAELLATTERAREAADILDEAIQDLGRHRLSPEDCGLLADLCEQAATLLVGLGQTARAEQYRQQAAESRLRGPPGGHGPPALGPPGGGRPLPPRPPPGPPGPGREG